MRQGAALLVWELAARLWWLTSKQVFFNRVLRISYHYLRSILPFNLFSIMHTHTHTHTCKVCIWNLCDCWNVCVCEWKASQGKQFALSFFAPLSLLPCGLSRCRPGRSITNHSDHSSRRSRHFPFQSEENHKRVSKLRETQTQKQTHTH